MEQLQSEPVGQSKPRTFKKRERKCKHGRQELRNTFGNLRQTAKVTGTAAMLPVRIRHNQPGGTRKPKLTQS